MKKKVFLSVPFAGRDFKEIARALDDTANEYKRKNGDDCEYEFCSNLFISSAIEEQANSSKIPNLVYLSKALETMANCDDVAFGEGWENARGCIIERLAYDLYISSHLKHVPK